MCLFLGLAALAPAMMGSLGIGSAAVGGVISGVAADAIAVGLAGSLMSAYGSYQSGQAQKEAANYQASLDRMRASMAEKQGFVEQNKADKQFAQEMGRARTAQAAGGVLLESPGSTSADYALGAAGEHAAEKSMIAQNAEMQTWGFSTQSVLEQYQGRMAARAGTMNAAGSLLSGIGQAGMTVYKTR